ncbi:SRPBCC family protein [Polaromonas sp.]|uniref:SRPBCC family protein n=1 Tax=Polaromonas sp. TaxID=1869339 RepID=UPI002FC92D27
MMTLKHEVSIAADVETVWRTLSDLLAVKQHNPSVVSVRILTDKTTGIGAARRCEMRTKDWVEEKVWAFDPPHVIGLEVAASSWPVAFMKWRTELRPDGRNTLVKQEMNYKLKFGVLGLLLDKLVMRRKLDASIQEVFERLKLHVENARP